MEFDSDWFDEEYYEECCNVENEDLPEDNDDFSDESDNALDNAAKLGLALGFGDFISNERLKEFPDSARHTNRENMSVLPTFASVRFYKKEKGPRSFEKFVDDLCKGRISINDENY
jgi:hypothetical protein